MDRATVPGTDKQDCPHVQTVPASTGSASRITDERWREVHTWMTALPILWNVLNMDTVGNTLTASSCLQYPSSFQTLIIILPPHRTRRDHARE